MRYLVLIVPLLLVLTGCTTFRTINYPPSSELFVTPGDDPGSESEQPYTPKGYMFVAASEMYLPLPFFGLIPLGNASPEYVFMHKAQPKIHEMGGDALIDTKIAYNSGAPFIMKLFGWGWILPKTTIISGTVVQR